MARGALRNPAEWLFDWLPAGGGCVAHRAAAPRLALDVLDRRVAGAARALHPHESAGVGGVEGASRRQLRRNVLGHRRSGARVPLPRAADDLHDVSLTRDAGFVSRFSEAR